MDNRIIYKKAMTEFNFAIQNGFSQSEKVMPRGIQLEFRKEYGKYLLQMGFAFENYTDKNVSLWFLIHTRSQINEHIYPNDYYFRFVFIPERLTDYNEYKITSLRNGLIINEQENELSNVMNSIVDNLKLSNNDEYLEEYKKYSCKPVNYDTIFSAAKLAEKSFYILDYSIRYNN